MTNEILDTPKMSKEEMIDTLKGLVFGTFDRTTTKEREALTMVIKALESQPCGDCISREALRQKLQENHDFYVNAYGSFKDMPYDEKVRVDEIINCISMVVNEPPVTPQPKTGHWIADVDRWGDVVTTVNGYRCDKCNAFNSDKDNFCPNCGAYMAESEDEG